MSKTPDPPDRDDPEAVIREELAEHRDALEALADLELGALSEDARRALDILDQADQDEEASS